MEPSVDLDVALNTEPSIDREVDPSNDASGKDPPSDPPRSVDHLAFDEMNLSMFPIGVLSNTPPDERTINLTPDGRRRLECTHGGPGLPTALADVTILGLMWLTQHQHGFQHPVVRFALRDLVVNYMFPGRYVDYNPSHRILAAVEEQLHRVAFTRIVSDGWYDRALGRTTTINAAVIDYVQVIDPGGKNRRRVLEVRWGDKFFQSILARYTKPIDPRILANMAHPIDRRLYRYLDQQLRLKPTQKVRSCQDFARSVLLMTGDKVDGGGRTASGYVVSRLRDSVGRLREMGFRVLGFTVRLDIDTTSSDFGLEFIRVAESSRAEAIPSTDDDPAQDLVRTFQALFHGVPMDSETRRLRDADRRVAQAWLATYGLQQSLWMIRKAKELHVRSGAPTETLLYFGGLVRYESVAAGAYEKHVTRNAREDLARRHDNVAAPEATALWESYRDQMLTKAESVITPEERESLTQRATEIAREEHAGGGSCPPGVVRKLAEVELRRLLLDRVGALERDEFLRELNALEQGFEPRRYRSAAVAQAG